MGLIDLPIPIGDGHVYNIPLEFLLPLIFTCILSAWFWRKSRINKKITTWILKLHKSGSAEVYTPRRELDTAVEYIDREGNEQRPFKPNYTYVRMLKLGQEVTTPEGWTGKVTKILDMKRDPNPDEKLPKGEKQVSAFQYEVEVPNQSVHTYTLDQVIPVGEKSRIQKSGSVTAIAPVGWNERIMIHPEGQDELFDFQRAWTNMDEAHVEEGGAARLLKEGADIFASLKERIRASFREIWWLWIIVGIMFFLGGMLVGGKYIHIQ